ncbi:MAG: class I SAM-dependent methyltransferase [Solirubrobacteraceae bacterium]|nr:class I SAM-dependent methyltransferase [Solirubrobacteraceae bacterium]
MTGDRAAGAGHDPVAASPDRAPRDWEAGTYERVATAHAGWGADVLDRLELRGDEAVLDAGCGSGKITAQLVHRLPEGRVVGVDGSPSMIAQASRVLPDAVDLQVQDLVDLVLADPVDVVVSGAVFHWIEDHDRLFARIAAVLRPGGRFEAQCGGAGNIASVAAAIDRLRTRAPWDVAFTGWDGPWHFAGAEETEERLRRAGFVDVRAWLEPRAVHAEDGHAYLRTVVLGSHLERLPVEAHDDFVEDVRRELVAAGAGEGDAVTLDYVRLNLSARRPADAPAPEPLVLDESPETITDRLRGPADA